MPSPEKQDPLPALSSDAAGEAVVLCKLFSDMVSEKLCLLRKKELNRKGSFSCEGCPMDEIITRRMQAVAEVLGTRRGPAG